MSTSRNTPPDSSSLRHRSKSTHQIMSPKSQVSIRNWLGRSRFFTAMRAPRLSAGRWALITAPNPIVSFPNLDVLKQRLERLDFLVVQDGFQPTPTSELALLVLPAAIWGEKEGTYTNSERRVSKVNRAVPPCGEARSDFHIF